MNRFKTAAVMLAALCVLATGCADKDNDKAESSSKAAAESTAESKTEESKADESAAEESKAEEEYVPGEGIAKMAEIFSEPYTYSVSVTYSDDRDSVIKVTAIDDGESYMVTNKETTDTGLPADTAYIYTDSVGYTIDYNIGAYVTGVADAGNIADIIIENKLDQTSTRIPEDTEGYIVEEYTYTAAAYITVYDIYFDEDYTPVKYTVAYSVEGEDDLVQNVQIDSLKNEAEKIDSSFLDDLTDFNALTEDERLAFCQQLCNELGITTDDMGLQGLTPDDFKRISFLDLMELIYTPK